MDNSLDLKNRELIKTDTSTNFFVEAGAGSGKTTELVERLLAMVNNGIDVSQICAITFTKAAANEFYERFQDVLIKQNTPIANKALENIDLMFMGTIDSFTNMIISEHPSEAGVPADSKVVESHDLHELWKAQLGNIANGEYGQETQEKYKRYVRYCGNSEEFFISGLDFLLNTQNAEFTYERPSDQNLNDAFKNEINEVIDAFQYLVGRDVKVLNNSKADEAAIYYAKLALNLSKNFEENFDSILRCINKLSGSSGLRFDKNMDLDALPGLPRYVKDMFYQSQTAKGAASFWLIKSVKDGGNPFHKKEFDNFKFNIAADFISSVAEPISEANKLQGALSYSDYLFYLKEMLKRDVKNGGKLIKHIYGRHKYYLIDEFQDTDPVQAEIFFYLTASNLSEIKTWKDCIPHPGSLFIVGDPKQSIYRFRNADVASYLNVKKLFENEKVGKVLTLSQNFRSQKPLCEWFNETFSEMLQEKPGVQSAYENIPIDDKPEYKANFGGAQKQIYIGDSLKKSPATKNLVTIISELVDNEKYTVGNPPEKIQYKDIMVITYKKDHLKFYMDALNQSNIPYFVEGNVLFDQCPSLTAISAMYNFIVDPQNKKSQTGATLMIEDGMSVDEAVEYNKRLDELTPTSLFSILIDEQKIIAKCGTENIEYLYFALELLRSKEDVAEISTHRQAAKFISDLIAGNTDVERCLQFSKDNNRVHLANLHKVKGLQAPVVIMTEAKMKNHDPQKHVDYMSENPRSCLFEISGSGFGSKLVNWNNEDEKQQEAEILEAEKDRLLYVAATRAKSAFIATDFTLKSGGVSATNQAVNLLDKINKKIEVGDSIDDSGNILVNNSRVISKKKAITNKAEALKLYDKSKAECVLNEKAENPTYKIELPSKAEHKKIPVADYAEVNNKRNAAFIGTIVHRLFELCVVSRNSNVKIDDLVCQVINEFSVVEQSDLDALKTASNEVDSILKRLKNATEVYCEMPFCYLKDKNVICDGVMDLVFKDDQGWHIVDYKTNFDERFLDLKYENQLNDYKLALKEILGVEATAEIVHIAV